MKWFRPIVDVVDRLIRGPQSASVLGPISTGGTGLRQAWHSWLEMKDLRRVGGSAEAEAKLADLDRRISNTFAEYFRSASIGTDDLEALEEDLQTLKKVVPTLSGERRQYYAMASALSRGILEALIESPSSN